MPRQPWDAAPASPARRPVARALGAAACAAALLAALTGCSALPLRKPAGTGEQRLTVLVKRYEFIPATMKVRKGKRTVITFRSGDVAYGVQIPELGLRVTVPAGASARLEFVPGRTGTFAVRCTAPGPQPGCGQMRAVLQVQD